MKIEMVKKPHHSLISRNTYTGREQDLITLMYRGIKRSYDAERFSQIKEGSKDVSVDVNSLSNTFEFKIDELQELFNLSKKGLYKALDSSTDGVMTKVCSVKFPDSSKFTKHTMCSDATFDGDVLSLTINPLFVQHMLDFSQGFTEVDLKLLLSLDGTKGYDKKILEMLSRFKNKRDFELPLGDFCSILGVSLDDYSRPSAFRASLLDNPLKKIVKMSEGRWVFRENFPNGYEIKKKSRSYSNKDILYFRMDYVELEKDKQDVVDVHELIYNYIYSDDPLIPLDSHLHTYQQMLSVAMRDNAMPPELDVDLSDAMALFALAKKKKEESKCVE